MQLLIRHALSMAAIQGRHSWGAHRVALHDGDDESRAWQRGSIAAAMSQTAA